MKYESQNKIWLEFSGFIFYLYELYNFFYHPPIVSMYDGTLEIFYLKSVLLLLALPLLYLFRIAYFFDWEETLSHFLSMAFNFENKNAFFQVKLFYYAINTILSILLFIEFIGFVRNAL